MRKTLCAAVLWCENCTRLRGGWCILKSSSVSSSATCLPIIKPQTFSIMKTFIGHVLLRDAYCSSKTWSMYNATAGSNVVICAGELCYIGGIANWHFSSQEYSICAREFATHADSSIWRTLYATDAKDESQRI